MKVLQLETSQNDADFQASLLDERNKWVDHIPLDIINLRCSNCNTVVKANPGGVVIIKETIKEPFQGSIDLIISQLQENHRRQAGCESAKLVPCEKLGPPGCLIVVCPKSQSKFLHLPIKVFESSFNVELLVQSSLAVDESILAVFKREDYDDISYKDFVTGYFFR